MLYELPQLRGEIRNIKPITNRFNSTIWTCQIFLSERLVYDGELSAVTARKEAIEAALRLARRIKKEAWQEIEFKAVGYELYVKWVDLEPNIDGYNGYYAIFHKGVQQFAVKAGESQSPDVVLAKLETLKLRRDRLGV